MRNTFAAEITRLAIKNKKIVLLSGDIGNKLFDNYKKKHKKRFFNCGVAEANMTTVAAGLAKSKFLPFTYTIASFNTYKIVEQIKLDICYPNLQVIIVGVGSGLSYSNLGTTHHSIEDIAVLNGINNLQIICPADPVELKSLIPQIIKSKKPTYLRIGKKNEKNVFKKNCSSKIGEPTIIKKGSNICVFSTGNILVNIMDALDKNKKKIAPQIVNIHTIKPINEIKILKFLKKFKKIIIIEEHLENGGLGSIIMKIAAKYKTNNTFKNINLGNKFITGAGDLSSIRNKFKLDSHSLGKEIFNF
jgi:transketolase